MIQFRHGTLILLASMLGLTQVSAAEQEMKPNGCKGVSLCHSYPSVDSNNILIDVGFLLEQMRISGTEFAFESNTTYGALAKSARLLRPSFKINWGVTAELGYHFAHDNWFLRSRFDWLYGKGKKSASSSSNSQIIPIGIWQTNMLAGTDVTYFSYGKTKMQTNYYSLDTQISRGSYLTDSLSFEPHAGLKLAFLYYDQDSRFTGGPAGTLNLKRDQDSQFWGIGPCFGFDSKWWIYGDFSFFCDSTVALLFGGTHMSDTVKYDANPSTYQTSAREHIDAMSPAVRAIIGFMYEACFCEETQHLAIRAGLDTNYYWNQFNHLSAVYNGGSTQSTWGFQTNENNTFGTVGLLFEIGWEF